MVAQVVLVLIAERRIQAPAVHPHVAFGVVGQLGRFVEGDRLGYGLRGLRCVGPVVAVAAQRHDRLGLVQPGQPLVEVGLEPVLT